GRSRSREQATVAEGLLQSRLDLATDVLVRVAHPGEIAVDGQGGVEGLALGIGDHYPELARHELGAEVVGVSAEAESQAAASEDLLGQRPQVGHEAIVSG